MNRLPAIVYRMISYILIALSVFFGLLTALFLWKAFQGVFDPVSFVSAFVFASACVLCVVKRRKDVNALPQEDADHVPQKYLAHIVYVSKACPVCLSRLAACDKNAGEKTLSIEIVNVDYVYFCPNCNQYFDTQEEYYRFVPPERPIPRENGTNFRFMSPIRQRFFKSSLMLTLAFLFTLLLSIFCAQHTPWGPHMAAGSIVGGLLSLFCVLYAFRYWRQWFLFNTICMELIPSGLILHERDGRHFYAWQDFRIVTVLPNYFAQKDAYLFDLKQRLITIDAGIEDHEALINGILSHIRYTAHIDSRLSL